MPLTFDPEIAAALAPMAASGFDPPAIGDIAGRRAMWEPIIGAASTAQPIPADGRRMIDVDHVTKRYGQTTAVEDLTFTLRPGIVTGFLGPNGAEKPPPACG
jgi:ABC-type multidrug transport system fused ATPase/permease subunit